MCRFHAEFKHFPGGGTKDFGLRRKVSSIMRAKLLSIMLAGDGGLTSLFKRFRNGLGYGLAYRPGT
jgi:hypothetical protein